MDYRHEAVISFLSDIVYIDDSFSLSLFHKEIEADQAAPIRKIVKNEGNKTLSEKRDINLEGFLVECIKHKEYGLMPIKYDLTTNFDWNEITKRKKMIIIDWDLGGDDFTGIDLFDQIQNNVLFICIYSNDVSSAIKEYSEKNNNEAQIIEGCVFKKDNKFVVFCSKINTNLEKIKNIFLHHILNNFGGANIFALSILSKYSQESNEIISKLKDLDKYSLLDFYNNNKFADEYDFFEFINEMIFGVLTEEAYTIAKETQLDIFNKFFGNIKNTPIMSNDEFEKAKQAISSDQHKPLDDFKIDYSEYKTTVEKIKKEDLTSYSNLSEYFGFFDHIPKSDKYVQYILLFLYSGDEKVMENFLVYEEMYKFYKQNNKHHSLLQTFKQEPDKLSHMNKAIGNIITPGQVFKLNDDYLLSITPSCQALRPEKIKGIFQFIKGKIMSKEDYKKKKDSDSHYFIKYNDDLNSKIIGFSFFDGIHFNFSKNEDIDEFMKYESIFKLKKDLLSKVLNDYTKYLFSFTTRDI